MKSTSVFSGLSSWRIGKIIGTASHRVIYAAPGIHQAPADALVKLAKANEGVSLSLCLDFDERTLRMGYGSLTAIECLRVAGIDLSHCPGFRCGILIVDERGWIFTPTAHYLEDEPQSEETPNAIELLAQQVEQYALRFCPATRQKALQASQPTAEASEVLDLPLELASQPITQPHFTEVEEALKAAPPVKFDVARQVRVFEPYLQYVEMSLTGAAIQRQKVRIPPDIQKIGSSKDLEGRLNTTFDLIEKQSELSSKDLEEALNELRKIFTPSMGKNHGRVILKRAKPLFERRIEELKQKLKSHQQNVESSLQIQLDESRTQVVDYYLPLAEKNPPDAAIARSLTEPSADYLRKWLDKRLAEVFPKAEELIKEMKLEVRYKDVTFETLNRSDFLQEVRNAFPDIDWDKAYRDYKAAGESQSSPRLEQPL